MRQNIKAFLKNIKAFFLMAFSRDNLIVEFTLNKTFINKVITISYENSILDNGTCFQIKGGGR